MRTDRHFRERPDADRDEVDGLGEVSELGGMRTQRFELGGSLSGNERNHLFLNRAGAGFEDLAGLSGLDHPADGRAAAALDYDRDGWLDFAVANANTPLFQLFRNEIGALPDAGARGVLALRFVGANRTAQPSPGRSSRDGYGAIARLDVAGATLLREHRAGEGFAAQSSAMQLVGLGAAERVERLRVRWPSGRVQEREDLPAGVLVTVYEDAAESPDGSGFALEPYRRSLPPPPAAPPPRRTLALAAGAERNGGPPLRLLTTMATWCEVCRGELPQIAALRARFGPAQLALVGVPVDEDDDAAALRAYRRANAPAYELLDPLAPEQREAVQAIVREDLAVDALPATIVTDGAHRVLRTLDRVPSVSEVRRWLAGEGA